MKRLSVVLALLGALAPGLVAHADRLSVARAQPLVEVSHSVDVEIVDGVARYRVRRTFANNGTRPEEASLRIELAHGAAVTSCRCCSWTRPSPRQLGAAWRLSEDARHRPSLPRR